MDDLADVEWVDFANGFDGMGAFVQNADGIENDVIEWRELVDVPHCVYTPYTQNPHSESGRGLLLTCRLRVL